MNYQALLEHSFAKKNDYLDEKQSRLEYLAGDIFDFTTYDSEMDELFAQKAVEVCSAINDQETYDYIADSENYRWYLIMVNMPFFGDKLEWGVSIRGTWWSTPINQQAITLESCGLWSETGQIMSLQLTLDEWKQFIAAIVEFAKTPEAKE